MQILHRGIFMPAFDRILQLARMEEMDCEFVEVTAHEVPAPPMRYGRAGSYHRGAAVVHDGERYEDFETATGLRHRAGPVRLELPPQLLPVLPRHLRAQLHGRTPGRTGRPRYSLRRRAVRRAFKHRANHWYNESDSTEDDERTASAFRIGHRAGTAVLPPCSTPQQLTGHKTKHPPGYGGCFYFGGADGSRTRVRKEIS